jgi:hypothetical protein
MQLFEGIKQENMAKHSKKKACTSLPIVVKNYKNI